MIDFIFYFLLFACGIIAACVQWNNVLHAFFKFDDYVKSVRPIIDEATGLPTGSLETVIVRNTFDPCIIVGVVMILIVVFFALIYWPAKVLFDHLENRYTPIIARFGLKRITYRKEVKRRGSWPLAYSNQFANFQE